MEPLFPQPSEQADAAPVPATLTVAQLLDHVRDVLEAGAGGLVWVSGELSGINRRGALRFELCGPDPRRAGHVVRIRAVVFRTDQDRIETALRAAGVELGDGVEIRVRGRVGVWPAVGQLQLVVDAVDPAFTVGNRELTRRALLGELEATGLLRAQARLRLPRVPRRIGLVAAPGTQGVEDFLTTLTQESAPFSVVLAPTVVQGPRCAASVGDAIRALVARHGDGRPLDAIAVVRGGGARDDLSGFDDRAVAVAIASAPVPVVTGLGHSGDRTVADVVAHRHALTPTDCAHLLCAPVRQARQAYAAATTGIVRALPRLLQATRQRHRHAAERVATQVAARSVAARRDLTRAVADLGRGAEGVLSRTAQRTADATARLDDSARRVVGSARSGVDAASLRTATGLRTTMRTAAGRLDALVREHRALDPQRVLERGYAVALHADGRPLRAASSRSGAPITVRLVDGTVDAVVGRGRAPRTRRREPDVDQPGLFGDDALPTDDEDHAST